MAEHETDDGDPAPLPPYERAWRHPAERAEQERDAFRHVAEPPPLSRRSRASVGSLAVVLCIVLLSIALPRGVGEAPVVTDTVVTSTAPPTTVPVKGFVSNPALLVTGSYGITSALPLDDGHLLTALEKVTGQDELWVTLPSGEDVGAEVVATDGDHGFALLRVGPADRDKVPRSLIVTGEPPSRNEGPLTATDLAEVRLIDHDGDQPATAEEGGLSTGTKPFLILTTPRTVAGVALVVGRDNGTLGVAVRKAQATWLVPTRDLHQVLAKVFGLVFTDK